MSRDAVPLEREIQAALLDYLRLVRRWPCWRMNSGLTVLPASGGHRRRAFRAGAPGMADIVAIIPPGGRWLAVEAKRPGLGRLRPAQAAWLEEARRAGAVALVAVGVDDLRRQLAEAGYPEAS